MTTHTEPDRLVLRPEAKRLLGVSHPTLWRMVKAGQLPPPTCLSKKIQGWPMSVIQAVIHGKVAPR